MIALAGGYSQGMWLWYLQDLQHFICKLTSITLGHEIPAYKGQWTGVCCWAVSNDDSQTQPWHWGVIWSSAWSKRGTFDAEQTQKGAAVRTHRSVGWCWGQWGIQGAMAQKQDDQEGFPGMSELL